MQTKSLQRLKSRNTVALREGDSTIADYIKAIRAMKNSLKKLRAKQADNVELQKELKAAIRGNKTPRPEGYKRRSHGKDDQRYIDWYNKQHATRTSPRVHVGEVINLTSSQLGTGKSTVDNTAEFLG